MNSIDSQRMSYSYKTPKLITLIVLLLLISGCSTIKTYFPDKHKEYVNSVEIAPLIIPADLSAPSVVKEKVEVVDTVQKTISSESISSKDNKKDPEKDSEIEEDSETKQDSESGLEKESKKEEEKLESKPEPEPERVRLISYAGGATRLQIDEPFVRAWRIVGKSLTRKSLEIIDRNINDGLFLVQYDPNEKDIEDDSIWDEIDFLFGDDKSNEQEYQIRLVEDRGLTEVLVLDQQGTPLSQGVGLTLLNLMHDTIKADLAAQQKE